MTSATQNSSASDLSASNTSGEKLSGHVVAVDAQCFDILDMVAERATWEAQGLTLSLAGAQTEDAVIAAAQDADVVTYMGLYTPMTARVLENLPRCGMVMRYGIGIETVDLDAATRLGIVVCNAAEFCVPEVADHTVALILNQARRIAYLDRQVRAGNWNEVLAASGTVHRLGVQTVGLVGFGRIARRVAQLMQPMVGRIVAYDPYVTAEQGAAAGAEMIDMDALLHQADYVSVHTPLMDTTRGLIGAAQLAKMQPTAFLINTSRGPVVDEAALIAALEARQIAGAALDVFQTEPLAAENPLLRMENVTLTPHTAANSAESLQDLVQTVIHSVEDFFAGRRPPHVVNGAVQPRRPWRS
ncbi:MAG: C-terminal binding protein [Litorilinea sp.]